MKAKQDSTQAKAAAPTASGELVSIFVPDDHSLLRLKRALDWEAITAVMIKHWRTSGKNVDGGRGLRWPVSLYVPLLVLMGIESVHSRQMEKYISESVVARHFLALTGAQSMHIRDHASIARAEAALSAQGRSIVNVLVVKTAQELGFTDRQILSSDTTVQEPAIGYPHEPGILKGMAERVARALKKLTAGGVKLAHEGIEKAKEIYRGVKEHQLFAKTKGEKKQLLEQIVKKSTEMIEMTKEVIQQVSARCGRVKQGTTAKLKRVVEVSTQLIPQIR